MAKTIEPISSWQNGEEKQATVFVLNSSFDNLSTIANFQYQLCEVISSLEYPVFNALISGGLSISGQDYLDWDAAVDANEWAYNWAAIQLKLIIIGEYVPPTPDPVPVLSTAIIEKPTS